MMYSKISSGVVSMNEGSVMVTQESRVTVFACRECTTSTVLLLSDSVAGGGKGLE